MILAWIDYCYDDCSMMIFQFHCFWHFNVINTFLFFSLIVYIFMVDYYFIHCVKYVAIIIYLFLCLNSPRIGQWELPQVLSCSEISHFAMGPWFFQWRIVIRNQDLSDNYVLWYCTVIDSRPFQWTEIGYMCLYANTHTYGASLVAQW